MAVSRTFCRFSNPILRLESTFIQALIVITKINETMKNQYLKTTFAIFSLAALAAPSANAQIFSEDFQPGYSTGNLSGQNGWNQGFGATPTPSATVVDASGDFYVSSTDNSYSILDAGNFSLTTADTITLTFDLRVTAASANAAFGIGNYNQTSSGSGTPPVFGVISGIWAVRGWGFGTTVNARDTNGFSLVATQNEWYRVQSTWDLSGTGTGTLSIMNLTLGETEFTQLHFNAAQTQTAADLQLGNASNPGVANWEGVFLRTQNGQIDNLSVIPEPSVYALISGGLMLCFVMLRRRRAV
jgi:hypothetical protein